jgi:hypothetical protein
MKCERDIIKYHLEAKHSMSLEEYIEQVIYNFILLKLLLGKKYLR